MPARHRNRRALRTVRRRRSPFSLERLEDRTLLAVALFANADVPLAIADEATVISRLTVSEPFAVEDLNVGLDIDHPADSQLEVFLIAPDGTRVELFSGVGG